MKTHLIMPMGGAGSRFSKNGILQPKPLIEIKGKPFLYWAASAVEQHVDVEGVTFVVLKKHVKEFEIDQVIREYYPDAEIIILEDILPGPVFTTLRGIETINDDHPVIFNDCDHAFVSSALKSYMEKASMDCDAGVLTFHADGPQYSYLKLSPEGTIEGTVEKKVVSDRAIFGAYLFRTADVFRKAAEKYVNNCPYSECFMSGIYNVLLQDRRTLREFSLEEHVEFGTPEELTEAMKSDYFVRRK